MKTLERMMLEMLFDKKEAPPTKAKKKMSNDLSLKQMIKIMKLMPTFKKEFEEALKALEPPKKDDKLTFWQKVVVMHVGALAYVATLALLFRLTFH